MYAYMLTEVPVNKTYTLKLLEGGSWRVLQRKQWQNLIVEHRIKLNGENLTIIIDK